MAGKKGDPREIFPEGQIRDVLAKRIRISGSTLERVKFIRENAKEVLGISKKIRLCVRRLNWSTDKFFRFLCALH